MVLSKIEHTEHFDTVSKLMTTRTLVFGDLKVAQSLKYDSVR